MPEPELQNSTVEERLRIGRVLASAGITDVYVLDRESARRILTERRLELIDHLQQHEAESVTSLARELGRDKKQVSDDLTLLVEKDVVEFDVVGKRKIPRLKHEHVIVEPIY